MSLIYFLLFFERPDFGYFFWGRCIDLFQMDLLIGIIWFNAWRRWRRLKEIDEGEK